jgi:hypothetical protein
MQKNTYQIISNYITIHNTDETKMNSNYKKQESSSPKKRRSQSENSVRESSRSSVRDAGSKSENAYDFNQKKSYQMSSKSNRSVSQGSRADSSKHLSNSRNLDLKIDSNPMETEKNNPRSKDVHQSVKTQEVRSFFMPNVGRSLLKKASIAHTEGNVRRSSKESQPEKLIFGVQTLR